ncbi:MAG TPA: hypothetical protein VNX68_07585, partial [Nitrosopumilaceae archaeon]|nr:hypothetical protein [Nitrosopumilaceae archaeon]
MDREFEALRLFAAILTPYETAGRYPATDYVRLSTDEIEKIIAQSEFILNFVVHRIGKVNNEMQYLNLSD